MSYETVATLLTGLLCERECQLREKKKKKAELIQIQFCNVEKWASVEMFRPCSVNASQPKKEIGTENGLGLMYAGLDPVPALQY